MNLSSEQISAVAVALLGAPNRHLSTRHQLRFGSHGSLAVDLSGERAGCWYDHEHGTGGGLVQLIRERKGLDEAAALRWIGDQGVRVEGRGAAEGKGARRIVATYDYQDEAGELVYQVVRYEPKDFRQRRPDGKGGWQWSTKGVRHVPYRLGELRAAVGRRTVFVAEGEKDVDNLRRLGVVATCNPGGAGKWPPHFAAWFKGADVVILPDNDEAGRKHAEAVQANLRPVVRSLARLDLPGLPHKGDPSDWIAAGGTAEALLSLAAGASTPWAEPPRRLGFRLLDLDALDQLQPPEWLLTGLLAESCTAVLYGPPRNLKSFVALAWALSIAYGLPWFERAVKQGAALYIAAEGAAGMKKRVRAWRVENGVEDASAPFALLPAAVNMAAPDGDDVARLLALIEEFESQAQQPLRLLVLDTLARCLIGADEDRAGDMGAFVQAVDLIRERTGAAVLIVHHSGKDRERGPRGSSSLLGAVDAAFECERDPAALLVTLRNVKQKDAEEAPPMTLSAATVEVSDAVTGQVVTSIVLRQTDERMQGKRARPALPPGAQLALDILADVLARQGTVSPPNLSDHIPAGTIVATVAAWREAVYSRTVDDEKADTKRKAFTRAAAVLQRAGMVAVWMDYAWLTKPHTN